MNLGSFLTTMDQQIKNVIGEIWPGRTYLEFSARWVKIVQKVKPKNTQPVGQTLRMSEFQPFLHGGGRWQGITSTSSGAMKSL